MSAAQGVRMTGAGRLSGSAAPKDRDALRRSCSLRTDAARQLTVSRSRPVARAVSKVSATQFVAAASASTVRASAAASAARRGAARPARAAGPTVGGAASKSARDASASV